jgi:hypothetical protein
MLRYPNVAAQDLVKQVPELASIDLAILGRLTIEGTLRLPHSAPD